MVYHKTKVERSIFRKLAFGRTFFSAAAPVPLIKVNRAQYMTTFNTGAAISQTDIAVYYPHNSPLEMKLAT